VYAFEPDPDNFTLLQHNIKANGFDQRVCAVQAALADDDGQGMLFLSENNLGDHQVFDVTGKRRSHPVTLLNGSEFLGSRANTVDLLKIDTQGSEHAVMMGLLPYLQQLDTPPHIIVELTPLSLRQAGTSGRALIDSLATLNQPFWIIDHIEHALAASDAEALAEWCDNVDGCAGDEGFMNILVGQGVEGC
ncbi:MAG: FkbM family methyltransferase, partial [Halieaceae bacterium]